MTTNEVREEIQQVYEFPSKGTITHLKVKKIHEDIVSLIEQMQSGQTAPSGTWITVTTEAQRDAITTMVNGDYCAVTSIRQVYEYVAASTQWVWRFNLDEIPASSFSHRIEKATTGTPVEVMFNSNGTDERGYTQFSFTISNNTGNQLSFNKLELFVPQGTEQASITEFIILKAGEALVELQGLTFASQQVEILIPFSPITLANGEGITVIVRSSINETLVLVGQETISGAPPFQITSFLPLYRLWNTPISGVNYVEVKQAGTEISGQLKLAGYTNNPDEFLKLQADGTVISAEAVAPNHNQTGNIQGGTTNEYYHLSENKFTGFGLPTRYGFVDNAETLLSFDNATHTFTLTKTGLFFQYFRSDIYSKINANKTVVLTNADGTYFIYFDANDGTLIQSTTTWSIVGTKVFVAVIIRRLTKNPTYLMLEERHKVDIPRDLHYVLHNRGSEILGGATMTYTIEAGTPSNASNCFGFSDNTILSDDGLISTIPAFAKPNGLTPTYLVMYRSAVGTFTWDGEQNVPFKLGTYIQYDNAGTLADVSNGDSLNIWVLATNIKNVNGWIVCIGQAKYSNVNNAYAATFDSNFDKTGLPFAEFVAAWQLTYTASASYSTTGKCKLVRAARIRSNSGSVPTVSTTAAAISTGTPAFDGLLAGATNVEAALQILDTKPTIVTEISDRFKPATGTFELGFVKTIANQTATLKSITAYCIGGTSVTIQLKIAGVLIGSPLTVTTSTTTATLNDIITNLQPLYCVISAVSGIVTKLVYSIEIHKI